MNAITGREDARLAQGERTRRSIMSAAMDIASVEGLQGLSIGRLASEIGMSKSGLFAHFGSKEDLQLATVEAARERFIDSVMRPALPGAAGLPRLWRLCDSWLTYAEKSVFRGGCFFVAASAEFDGRPGRVRDSIGAAMAEWVGALEQAVDQARQLRHLDAACEPSQLAFELNALGLAANWAFQLYGDRVAFDRARSAVLARLRGLATNAAPSLPPPTEAGANS